MEGGGWDGRRVEEGCTHIMDGRGVQERGGRGCGIGGGKGRGWGSGEGGQGQGQGCVRGRGTANAVSVYMVGRCTRPLAWFGYVWLCLVVFDWGCFIVCLVDWLCVIFVGSSARLRARALSFSLACVLAC